MIKILRSADQETDVEKVLRAVPAVVAERRDEVDRRTEEADLVIKLFGNPRNSHRKPERTRISRRHL